MHGKCNGVALPQRDDFGAALHARPLFGDDELPARKILIRFRKQDRHLQRKREVAVQILMQTIEVARHVLQEKRCRPGLTRRVALPQKFHVTLRVTTLDVHLFVPGIGHYRQTRIERSSQASEEIWQRILEVAVFAFTESMPSHVDVTTEEVFIRIERSDFPALIAGNQFVDDRATETVQIGSDPVPILLFQSDFSGPHRSGVRADDGVLFHAMAPSFQWFEARSPCVTRNPILARLRGWRALSDNPPQLGGILNEAGDIISDIALFPPLMFVAPFAKVGIGFLILLTVACELAGIGGPMLGSDRRLEGP